MSEEASDVSRKRSESGKKGGAARAKALSPERRKEIARNASAVRKQKKGGPKPKPPELKLQNVPSRVPQVTINQLNEIAETTGEKRGEILARLVAREHKRVMKTES